MAKATTRTAPLVFSIYDLVLLWHAQSGHKLAAHSVLDRLWYAHKTSVSFEDILRTLRHATWHERIFDDPAFGCTQGADYILAGALGYWRA